MNRSLAALSSILFVAVGACSSGSALGDGPARGVTFGPDNTVAMGAPMMVSFERFASTCGVMNPPFKDDDDYTLGIYQFPIDGEGDYTIGVFPRRTVPVGQDLSIALGGVIVTSFTGTQEAMTNVRYGEQGHFPITGSSLDFDWEQGSVSAQLLSGPALVHVATFPTRDGDPIDVHIKLGFADGRTLDVTSRVPLVTEASGCPAG
jgi:hypothetical protein